MDGLSTIKELMYLVLFQTTPAPSIILEYPSV